MLFSFLKYLQPVHYFILKRQNRNSIFPIVNKLPDNLIEQLKLHNYFSSPLAKEHDLSWQAIQKGYIGNVQTYSDYKSLSLKDNYAFIRTYFHKAWVWYVLLVRILSFNNPIKELQAFISTRNVARSKFLKAPIVYGTWPSFQSILLQAQPFVSIIIPTLNRYTYLQDVLRDLEKQNYQYFEVIIFDQSYPYIPTFYKEFDLDIKLYRQEEKALWLARNNAIKVAKGDLILLFDDDSRVKPNWIENHIKCLDYFNADLSSGISISKVGDKVPDNYSFFRLSDQLDTGNVMIKKGVFKSIGLFDRQFEKQRMGDAEFGLRAFLNGYLNVSNPFAERLHLKVGSGGLRDMGSWDAFRPTNWLGPRPIPSVLYYYRKYYGNEKAKWALLRLVPLSIMPYRFKKNKLLSVIGFFLSILLLPIVALQVYRSWKLSSKKLAEGARIDLI